MSFVDGFDLGRFAIRIKIIRVSFVCLLLFWMGVIFTLSSQTASESSATSGRIITMLLHQFYPSFHTLSDTAREEVISSFQFIARKTAHVLIYVILGFFSFLSVLTYNRIQLWQRAMIAVAICVLYSVSDEWHQTIVSGRSGELRDILIDSTGALISVLFFLLLSILIKPIYRRVKFVESRETTTS